MIPLVIQFHQRRENETCALCGDETEPAAGPRLILANGAGVVCRRCGKKQAASLVALMDLAATAERVGRIGRHTVSPPFAALLELARAAENYSYTLPQRVSQAA